MKRPELSGCVITFNEADRIADCLESLRFCDELLVVDSHSTDATREIAAGLGARVIERDWPGFGPQKEFTAHAATHDWVLCLDADERVSPELRAEVERLRDAGFPEYVGWEMPRLSFYLGRWIRHGVWYPDRCLRLYDRRHGHWGGGEPHSRVLLDGPPGRLTGVLHHRPYRSLSEHVHAIDRYTTTMARGMHEAGRRARGADLVARPVWAFLTSYVVRRGFLDGWPGIVVAFLHMHYVFLKYAKLRALERGERDA